MIFKPRVCQLPMIDLMARMDRGNIFASPGTGKTSAVLAALDALTIASDVAVWPVLVVAPQRVANVVWEEEVNRWARFQGIRVAKMVGLRENREAALRSKADIYTINPANLVWLHKVIGHKWPFKTVIADESTLIKNHRVHFRQSTKGRWSMYVAGSAKGARALVRHAPSTNRWYCLSGTPVPNGVVDLWGQCWPIDYGASLGRTFTDFKERWFKPAWGSTREAERLEPLPFAEEEILERIKPYSVSINAYDYFDIDKPIELDISVHLPAKARAMYATMHRDSIVELESSDAVAANMGSKVMKCRQIASGHLRDEHDEWHTVHTAKLDALGELVDKLDGSPLLVAYYFKEDLAAIKKRFKTAVELPKGAQQKEVEARWNEGRISMLLVHPQSAGHGLNLQWGSNHLCLYTPDWNAEYYEQVIERIGPTRQMQAGLDRMVFIHRLVVRGTWEEVVLARLRKKMSVTEMVKMALSLED